MGKEILWAGTVLAVAGISLISSASTAGAQTGSVEIAVTETITVSDAPSVLPPVEITIWETIGVAESLGVFPPATVTVSEEVVVQDSPQVTPPASVVVAETITVADAPMLNHPPAVSTIIRRFLYTRRLWTMQVATFTDLDSSDSHTATIDWGDGAVTSGVVNEIAHTVRGSHIYVNTGTYTVTVTVTDSRGGTGTASFDAVVRPHPRLRIPFFS